LYKIVLTRRAEKDLAAIPQEHRIRIENVLERFAASPDQRHDIVKVKDSPKIVPRYRLRIGEYRATFYMHHNVLIIEILTV
jgi:mRNA-degrading endonuclease RelE of RelBE toxin-antitoxin system